MMDFLERMESAAERQYDDMYVGDGKLKCGCGNIFNPDNEGGTLSPNPYAMPVCGGCFDEAFPSIAAPHAQKGEGDA